MSNRFTGYFWKSLYNFNVRKNIMAALRIGSVSRKTAETDISIELNLDGTGKSSISTGCGFLNHMLTLFAKHGRFDLNVSCNGDTQVDDHHPVEDIGIALGEAFAKALGLGIGIVGAALKNDVVRIRELLVHPLQRGADRVADLTR